MDIGTWLLVIVLGVFVVVTRLSRRGVSDDVNSILVEASPSEVIRAAVSHLSGSGFTISHADAGSVGANRRRKPNWEIVVGLVLLIFPGIALAPLGLVFLAVLALPTYLLYFAAVRPRHGLSVVAFGEGDGVVGPSATRVTASGDDRKGRVDLIRWMRENQGAETAEPREAVR